MTTAVVLDAGALIALDRNDRDMWAVLRIAADESRMVQVPAGVVAQAWRDGSRQALLARALRHCDEIPLDGDLARAAGLLCGRTDTLDVIDATVAIVASAHRDTGGAVVFTSDPDDLAHLLDGLDASAHIEAI